MSDSGGVRSADEIRASIEQNRVQLSSSLIKLHDEVTELTDWRAHLRRNQSKLTGAAAAAGFVLAGGVGSLAGALLRTRKRGAKPTA